MNIEIGPNLSGALVGLGWCLVFTVMIIYAIIASRSD